MADLEDVTLDGRPLQSLRVADLKAALEERGLSKSGQKNALIKRLKGALMLENLQKTSTAHVGLQPNSQIGEEMSQNSFIKQYLAKQQELLRQRLEREAREAYETNEQEGHTQVNNSTSCPPPAQEVTPAAQHKPPGPSDGEGFFGSVNAGQGNRNQEADVSSPPASGSMTMRAPASEQRSERGSASSEVAGDSDDDDSEEDGGDDDEDWGSSAPRRSLREPARVPAARSGAARHPQPQQQHIPPLLSPQLRQPTPPPSPPPELSFPLPDTPKQSPPSPPVAAARHSPSSSSSGSSSSGSRSSSPEPQRSADRKPGPLTLLARKMESEGAFSGGGWHGPDGEGDRQDSGSPSPMAFPGKGPLDGLGSSGVIPGTHTAHIQLSGGLRKAAVAEERERERAIEIERQEKQRQLELAAEEERQRAIALERERERIERQQALEKEEREKREREREEALAREREERERAMELERQKELERQRALEEERLLKERKEKEKREREEMERAMERERAKERERLERERALEAERREKERLERERVEREKALEKERLEKERIERERALEKERLEKERIERERALEQERLEKERIEREKAQEQERLEKERIEREKVLEKERLEKERIEREKALAQERLEKERIEREKAAELERIEREQALEQERIEREKSLEKEKLEKKEKEREQALERERREREKKEQAEREAALEQERMAKERAEKERKEQIEREKALELEKLERAQALEKEKERAQEQERLEKQMVEEQQKKALHQEKERDANLLPPSGVSAPERENAHAPVAQRESQPSDSGSTPLSPQSSSKKFRFLRDSPARPHSGSIVIKRPRTFSDTPQPRASPVTTPTSIGDQRPGGTLSSTNQEDAQIQSKQDVGAMSIGSTGTSSDGLNANRTAAHPDSREETSASTVEATLPKTEESVEGKDERKDSSISEDKSGREAKKEEKKARRRSSSNESSSADSDSGSSSSRSSSSSSSSQDKAVSTSRNRQEGKRERGSSPLPMEAAESQSEDKERPKASHPEKELPVDGINTADGDIHTTKQTDANRKRKHSEMEEEEEEEEQQRQEKEPSTADPEKSSESSEEAPKTFSGRKIYLGSSKQSPGNAEAEHESGAVAGRKRRWGSSTAVTAKKPSISITTESLKSLIPDIRPPVGQEAVVDLHPEEAALSGAEDEERERSDQDLQIRRTVTQVVPGESQENGQKEAKRMRLEDFEDDDSQVEGESVAAHEEQMDTSLPATVETQSPTLASQDTETNTVTPSDTLIRRSISQQKTGVSITIDDPVRTARQPSPPRGQASSIVHIWNLVRPFTLGQLKELLSRTGTLVEDGFWIDKIKSHCYVTYSSTEEAVATRAALHGVKWPQSNPKVLRVDFCQQDELDYQKNSSGAGDRPGGGEDTGPAAPGRGRTSGLPSLLPERDQWAEREREMERRERARAEREWDRDKVKEFGKPGEEREGGPRRSPSRERRRKERGKSKEKKMEKKAEDPPAKLLDDLFRKTKAVPCIYWLPLTEEQFLQREAARAEEVKEREERRKEREKRRKEEVEEEEKKKEEERKERTKAAGSSAGNRSEGEKDKNRERERDRDRGRDRDRDRDRENDKRRDGYRRSGGGGAGSSRRSRSRSEPRDRRR